MATLVYPAADPLAKQPGEYPPISDEQLRLLLSQNRVNNPTEVSLDKEISARVDETFREGVKIPEEIAASLGDDSSLAAVNRVITNGESSSLEFLDSFKAPKDQADRIGKDILQVVDIVKTTESSTGINLTPLLLKLHENYYLKSHIPRMLAFKDSANEKKAEIKDLNELTRLLNGTSADKQGNVDLSEHKELLARIAKQEGISLLDKEGVWTKDSVKMQVEDLKRPIQNKANEMDVIFKDMYQEKDTMSRLFEPVKHTVEQNDRLMGNMARRMNA